jgi:hypothetical protein
MRAVKFLVVLGFMLALSGCVASVQPLYTETKTEVVFDTALVGTWLGDNETIEVAKADDNSYDVTYTGKGKPGKFRVYLIQLGKYRFIDVYPDEPKLDANDTYKAHLLGVHTISKISLEGNALTISPMDPDWLKGALEHGDVMLPHVLQECGRGDHCPLLTASPEQLQSFYLKYGADEKAFPPDNAGAFRRK